jgi:hypothetical protein
VRSLATCPYRSLLVSHGKFETPPRQIRLPASYRIVKYRFHSAPPFDGWRFALWQWSRIELACVHHVGFTEPKFITSLDLAVVLLTLPPRARKVLSLTYLQLCAEDHRWWWMSFSTARRRDFNLLYLLF